jgi:hypothetical protein
MRKSVLLLMALASLGMSLPAQAQSGTFAGATVKPKFVPDPMELQGISGGTQSAKAVAGTGETPTGACLGYVDEQPDHVLSLTAGFKYLSIVTDSKADTTIVIKGPGGVWCNDDYQGKNAGISGQWLEGEYKVWVGGYKKDKSTPYTLKLSETR